MTIKQITIEELRLFTGELLSKSYMQLGQRHEQLIWNEASKEPERRDKRLKYRSRKGTGLNSISNNIKQIK